MYKFVAVLIAALSLAGTASAAGEAFAIKSDGLCLTSDVKLAECTGKQNQRWTLQKLNGHYAIRNQLKKECLAVGRRGNPTMQRCTFKHNQHFKFKEVWMSDGVAIVSAVTDECLDVDMWNGETVQMYDCHGGSNQQWQF